MRYLLAFFLSLATASAAIKHVSNSTANGRSVGSDANDGTSWGSANLTVEGGIADASNGDTVLINDGTYTLAAGDQTKNLIITGDVWRKVIINTGAGSSIVTYSSSPASGANQTWNNIIFDGEARLASPPTSIISIPAPGSNRWLLTFNECQFRDISVTGIGNGNASADCSLAFKNCHFHGGSAGNSGKLIHSVVRNSATFSISGCVFYSSSTADYQVFTEAKNAASLVDIQSSVFKVYGTGSASGAFSEQGNTSGPRIALTGNRVTVSGTGSGTRGIYIVPSAQQLQELSDNVVAGSGFTGAVHAIEALRGSSNSKIVRTTVALNRNTSNNNTCNGIILRATESISAASTNCTISKCQSYLMVRDGVIIGLGQDNNGASPNGLLYYTDGIIEDCVGIGPELGNNIIHGIMVGATTRAIIRRSVSARNNILFLAKQSNNATVEGNIGLTPTGSSGGSGIYFKGCTDGAASHNTLWWQTGTIDNSYDLFRLDQIPSLKGNTNIAFVNNLCYANERPGNWFQNTTPASVNGCTFTNNSYFGTDGGTPGWHNGSTFVTTISAWRAASPLGEPTAIETTPNFTDRNVQLARSSSLVGAGATLANAYYFDGSKSTAPSTVGAMR